MIDLGGLYRDHIRTLTDGYHRALDETGFEAVVVHAGRLAPKSPFDDQDWPFAPVPAFLHWAGLRWPDSAVIVRRGQAPRLLALRSASFWERPEEPDFGLLRQGLEVQEIRSLDEARRHLEGPRIAFVGHEREAAQALGIDDVGYVPHALVERLHDLRVIKTPYEIACLAEANRVAARGHRAVADAFEAGVRSELDLHLTYLMATGQDDPDCPYKSIVALGDSAAVLHHNTYREAPEAGSLLVDAGAKHRALCSDITRTTPAEGASAFGELVARMDELQRAVVARIEIGMPYEALHDHAHALLAELLVEVGLAKVSAEACVESGLTRLLFPHGLGHSLGVQVHDVGCRKAEPRPENRFLRNTSTLAAGQVLTIEPGLYFIDHFLEQARGGDLADALDWKMVDALAPYGGIRIEDDVAVEPAGSPDNVRNLTREAFAGLDEE